MNLKSRIGVSLFVAAMFIVPFAAHAQFVDQRSWAPSTAGTANAQTVAITNVQGPNIGVVYRFQASLTNTGPLQLNINGTGLKPVMKPSPGGPVATSGGEVVATQIAAVMFDGTNYQLISNLNATASQIVPEPGGYLTPCTQVGTPVAGCTAGQLLPTGDVVGATTLYYTSVASGGQIPIWNGSQYIPFPFSELTLTLGSSNLANTAYDVCVFNNSGTPTIATSVAWSSSAAGSSARGTGAGTAQIGRTNGFWTNTVPITGRNGANTYSIPANQCTVIGSIYIDAANGQVTFNRTYGQSRKWSAFNFYNRQHLYLKGGDPNGSWNTAGGGFHPSDSSTSNSLLLFSGLAEEDYNITFNQHLTTLTVGNGTQGQISIGIGYNSTSVASGLQASIRSNNSGATPNGGGGNAVAQYIAQRPIGPSVVTALENLDIAGPNQTNTSYGTEANMLLLAQWRG